MEKNILSLLIWLFLIGGLFGMTTGFVKFFGNGTPSEFGVLGIGGGLWLLSAAIVIYIRNRISAK